MREFIITLCNVMAINLQIDSCPVIWLEVGQNFVLLSIHFRLQKDRKCFTCSNTHFSFSTYMLWPSGFENMKCSRLLPNLLEKKKRPKLGTKSFSSTPGASFSLLFSIIISVLYYFPHTMFTPPPRSPLWICWCCIHSYHSYFLLLSQEPSANRILLGSQGAS